MRSFDTLSRRGLLLTLGAGGALAGSGRQALADPVFAEYPFQLGIAAGDPTPDGFVIWTRLAPRPLQADGGMTQRRPVAVRWEVAEDDAMITIGGDGTTSETSSSPFDLGCQTTRSSGIGVVLALGFVLRRRRRR